MQLEALDLDAEWDDAYPPWVETLLRCGQLTQLDRATVAESVRQILIFDDRHLEITYTFSNQLGLLETEGRAAT